MASVQQYRAKHQSGIVAGGSCNKMERTVYLVVDTMELMVL